VRVGIGSKLIALVPNARSAARCLKNLSYVRHDPSFRFDAPDTEARIKRDTGNIVKAIAVTIATEPSHFLTASNFGLSGAAKRKFRAPEIGTMMITMMI
jgi:hypothetical protein